MAKEKAKADREKCRVVTPMFRVSYPHVFKPQAMKGAEPKYSITMLFSKNTDMAPIKRAIKAAMVAHFGADESDWPEDMDKPIKDGDKPKYADKEGYKGHFAVKAISNQNQKPSVVDKDLEDIVDAADFYPGCYARACIFARVWEFNGKQGVHFILDHVQKLKDGKSFGGKPAVDKVFSPMDADDEESESSDDDSADEEGDDFM